MNALEILETGIRSGGSDIYIIPGSLLSVKINGVMTPLSREKITSEASDEILRSIYEMANHRPFSCLENGDDDFSVSVKTIGRFRCSAYRQRGSLAAVLRAVPFGLPDPGTLGVPEAVMALARQKRGMILVTGPAGSGKSTTLACLIDRINQDTCGHIITIEDPIEYLHPHKRSVVSQREVGGDTASFAQALRAALRQSPDVILLGEMRDYETIHTALTAAETGHLLLSTLHTVGAAKTIDRIIDVFPANQQQQVRVQLSMVLRAVVSQQLIPSLSGELVPAFEIMLINNAVQNMIREGKVHQMDNVIFSGQNQGMTTMDGEILRLYREKCISRENALLYAINPDSLLKKLGQ